MGGVARDAGAIPRHQEQRSGAVQGRRNPGRGGSGRLGIRRPDLSVREGAVVGAGAGEAPVKVPSPHGEGTTLDAATYAALSCGSLRLKKSANTEAISPACANHSSVGTMS